MKNKIEKILEGFENDYRESGAFLRERYSALLLALIEERENTLIQELEKEIERLYTMTEYDESGGRYGKVGWIKKEDVINAIKAKKEGK